MKDAAYIYQKIDKLWPKRGDRTDPNTWIKFLENIAQEIYPSQLSGFFQQNSSHFDSGRLLTAKKMFEREQEPRGADVFYARNALWRSANDYNENRDLEAIKNFKQAIVDFLGDEQFLVALVKNNDSHFESGRLLNIKLLIMDEPTFSAPAAARAAPRPNPTGAPKEQAQPRSNHEIAQALVDNREALYREAYSQINEDHLNHDFDEITKRYFVLSTEFIRKNGGSLRAIILDKTCQQILKGSRRTTFFLMHATDTLDKTPSLEGDPKRNPDTDAEERRAGLLTELGIFKRDDVPAVLEAARRIALAQHPDKNAGVEGRLLKKALDVIQMARDGDLAAFIEASEKERANMKFGR